MDWPVLLSGALTLLLFVMLTGLPVFIAFLVVNVLGVVILLGLRGSGLLIDSVSSSLTNTALAPIPLFLLMGEVLFRSGSVGVLFDAIDALVGRVRGRLYVVTILLSTIFGALSGSAIAVAAMLGRSVYPLMIDRHYDSKLSIGVILAGACLAPIIPPSLVAVIIGSLADVSIASLLIAGIVPGLIISALTLAYVFATMPRDAIGTTDAPPPPAFGVGGALLRILPFSIVIFSVMGLILLGIATPSEAAGTGVVGAMCVAAIYRKLSFAMMREALLSAARVSGAIMLIVASSVLLGQLLALGGASSGVIGWVSGLDIGQTVMLLAMMAIPLILCMFIDQIAFMLAAIPLYQPILQTMDVEPVWFWTLFAVNLTIGTITPPFGYTLFALTASGPRAPSIRLTFRASWPIVSIMIGALGLFFVFPQIVLWPLGDR